MAGTSVGTNNAVVKYRGKAEREMPSESQAQNRFMRAVAAGKVKGVKRSVGKKFVAADAGRRIGKLPQHVKRLRKRGLISDKAAKKHGLA